MKQERLLTIIKAPHVSEKASQSANNYQQLVFEVRNDATKPELKIAVEELFNVKVRSVRVCNTKPKAARFGQIKGQHQAWKKAYITLEQGSVIDLSQQTA